MADLSNFWFLHLAAFNYCFAGDPHPIHFCPIWCGAKLRRSAAPRRAAITAARPSQSGRTWGRRARCATCPRTTQDEIDAIPRVLFERAEAVGDRAHDFYEAGRAPIQWNDVADAATIARLQIPAGFGFGVGDAFPSSESVARSVVAALAARSAG